MSAHTPGPWNLVVENRRHAEPSYYVTAADPDASKESGHLEVPFHVGLAGGNARTLASGRTEANARLIAAAPELLEAVRTIDQHSDSLDGLHDDEAVTLMLTGRELKAICAAIAKAEGKR